MGRRFEINGDIEPEDFDPSYVDGAAAAASLRTLGTGATQAAAGDHAHPSTAISVTATNVVLGRSTAGSGAVEEIACTAAGRALIDDANAAAQLVTLGAVAATRSISTSGQLSGGGDLSADRTLTWTDPLTPVVLGSTFSTDQATAQNVTGFKFTPAASKTYIIEGQFLVRSSGGGAGPGVGMTWPTGYTDGVCHIEVTSGSVTNAVRDQRPAGTACVAQSFSLPATATSYPAQLRATLVTGGSPSGDFQITLQSSSAGTSVSLEPGSSFVYRTVT